MVQVSSTIATLAPGVSGPSMARRPPCCFASLRTINPVMTATLDKIKTPDNCPGFTYTSESPLGVGYDIHAVAPFVFHSCVHGLEVIAPTV